MAFRRRYTPGEDDGGVPAPYQPPANAQPPQGSTTPPAPAPPAPAPRPTAQPRPAVAPAPTAAQSSPYGDLSGFKTYADWRAASGADSGEIQQWYNRQLQPNQGAGGVNIGATGASANTSQSLGGVTLPTGATGFNAADPTAYRKIDPNILRNMTPEQRAEWSAQNIDDLSAHGDATRARAQWLEWQKSYDPNCPPSDPYQAEDGSGCVEKPDNSNKGYQAAGAGGPGGGGVGGGGGGAGFGAGGGMDDMNAWWQQQIKGAGTSRYTPEAMAAMEADSFARARRQEKLQLDAANRDMAERGVRGSQVMNTVKRDIASKTSGQIQSDRANLMRAKIDADYADKQAAIKNAESWVNSMRDYLLRTDANSIQREQIQAQIRLAMQNISAQKDMMEQSYQNQLSMAYSTGGIG